MDNNNSINSEKHSEISQRAAKLLAEFGYFENAAELYDSTGLSKEIESLILKQAHVTLDQSQLSLLQNLINTLPGGHHPPYPEALNCIAMARVRVKLAEYEKAESWLIQANTLVDQIDSSFLSFNLFLSQAELYYSRGDNKAVVAALAQAMGIGRRKSHLNTDWWRPSTMCGLCIKALENNIEVDYVQTLIKKRKLYPNSPPLHLDNWPWRVRIYTLGRFCVLLDGKPISVNGKGKNKPIELLKALIAMGGRDVSEARLCEALWPDADGDNAHSSFTSTLSRLRKLLGSDVLVVCNGQLSLNDQLCWLDIWAYDRNLGELESALSYPETQQIKKIDHRMHRMFDLYHGFFMEKEPQPGWLLPQRERLQTKLLRIIKQLISFYSSRDHCKKVITLYEKALELDPLSEEYYRGLMRCHAAQGNNGKALSIYNHCQTILDATFAIKPSEKTRQLHSIIKSGNHKQLQLFCLHCSRIAA